MRILITCEFSGKVREAMRALGHDAWSCDFLPAEDNSPFHFQDDALEVIQRGCPMRPNESGVRETLPWELIGIHYTCTFFCNSGVQWLYLPRTDGNPGRSTEFDLVRRGKMILAAKEFSKLWNAAVATGAKVYFENPQMHAWAQMEISNRLPGWNIRPTQWIQPCDYGHPETKKTGLWLHGLPKAHADENRPERDGATSREREGTRSLCLARQGSVEGEESHAARHRASYGDTMDTLASQLFMDMASQI